MVFMFLEKPTCASPCLSKSPQRYLWIQTEIQKSKDTVQLKGITKDSAKTVILLLLWKPPPPQQQTMFTCWSQPYMQTNFHNQSLTKDNAWVVLQSRRLRGVPDVPLSLAYLSMMLPFSPRSDLSVASSCAICTFSLFSRCRHSRSRSRSKALRSQWHGLLGCYFTIQWVTVILFDSGMGYCDTVSFTVEWVTVTLFYSGMGFCDTVYFTVEWVTVILSLLQWNGLLWHYFTVQWVSVIPSTLQWNGLLWYCLFYSEMGYCDTILQWNGFWWYHLLYSEMGYCDTAYFTLEWVTVVLF